MSKNVPMAHLCQETPTTIVNLQIVQPHAVIRFNLSVDVRSVIVSSLVEYASSYTRQLTCIHTRCTCEGFMMDVIHVGAVMDMQHATKSIALLNQIHSV